MRKFVLVCLLVALVSSKQTLEQNNLQSQETQDFVTGFFLAMRAAEFCPHAFECVTNSQIVMKAFADFQAKLAQDPSIVVIIKAVEELVKDFSTAEPVCQALSQEGKAYLQEIDEIITGQTFALVATVNLLKNTKNVIRDVKDYNEAKNNKQMLVAGQKIGDIGRIIVWGTPSK